MILEVMQRDFVSRSAATLGHMVDTGLQLPHPTAYLATLQQADISKTDIKLAAEWFRSLQPDFQLPEKEDAVFIPQDPAASVIQSVLQRYFLERKLVQDVQGQGATEATHPISTISLLPTAAQKPPEQLLGEMSETDIAWASCLLAKAYRHFGKRRPFPDKPAESYILPENSIVYLIGDWGSGVSRAKKIADRIRARMLAESRPQHVVHLGDVYYSGWPEEYDDHFLVHWPVRPGEEDRFTSWCLNGNHDMYSGGYGYFDHLLKDKRFQHQQGKSFFSLQTNKWQFLGLDTAWENGQLAGSQLEWIESQHRSQPGKNLVLMSHHQPFSSFESNYPGVESALHRAKVHTWFWGHEHRFAMYLPRPNLQNPRLIGHSGVPVWTKAPWKFWTGKQPKDVQYVGTKGFRSGLESFQLFGFAILDFQGGKIHATYIDEHGEKEKEETLQ
jgi:hypothetical protein